jgi:hypothetical protein
MPVLALLMVSKCKALVGTLEHSMIHARPSGHWESQPTGEVLLTATCGMEMPQLESELLHQVNSAPTSGHLALERLDPSLKASDGKQGWKWQGGSSGSH